MKDSNISNKSFRYLVVGTIVIVLAAILTAISFGYYIRIINTIEDESSLNSYEKHYAFVVDDNDSEFWNQVYKYASSYAEEDGIYLEDLKNSIKSNYTNEDLLRIAINSSVAGIIYAGSASEEAVELINEATDKGIGVAVLHNDIEQSQRQCFVGVSNYEIGQMYASQLIEIIDKEEMPDTRIAILVSSDVSEGATNLISLAIEDSLLENMEEISLPEIEVIRIDAEDTFSVEEDIRNIFMSNDQVPDVMLCLEGIYTQCVYQAVVDYNMVGDVNIIGYFANDDILEAIDKQIIFSTISIDTKEMGQSGISAIKEYNETGYTNSYMPISMEIIDQKKAHEMLGQTIEAVEE